MAKTLTGVVSSDKVDKTIVVTIRTRKTHPLYKKQYTVTTKFMAHDEKNQAKIGDKVIIGEVRPISRSKHFALQEVVQQAGVAFVEPDAPEVLEAKPKAEKPAKAKKVEKTEEVKEETK
jgi:small subunit ribosomal protein S17